MKTTLTKLSLVLVASLSLGACSQPIGMGSEIEQGPVSTGKTVKELKSTPCACTEIPMNFEFLSAV
jgi:predicted small secreted protein